MVTSITIHNIINYKSILVDLGVLFEGNAGLGEGDAVLDERLLEADDVVVVDEPLLLRSRHSIRFSTR